MWNHNIKIHTKQHVHVNWNLPTISPFSLICLCFSICAFFSKSPWYATLLIILVLALILRVSGSSATWKWKTFFAIILFTHYNLDFNITTFWVFRLLGVLIFIADCCHKYFHDYLNYLTLTMIIFNFKLLITNSFFIYICKYF